MPRDVDPRSVFLSYAGLGKDSFRRLQFAADAREARRQLAAVRRCADECERVLIAAFADAPESRQS